MTDDFPKAIRRTAYTFVGILILVCMIGFLVGCAQTSFTGICGYQPLGSNEAGVPFLAVVCEAKQ
jgi:hypothetical protein